MLALSIRQPFAELILRGIKTAEFRTRPTRIIGERFLIYASKAGTKGPRHEGARGIWSADLSTHGKLPEWMIELAEQVKLIPADLELPRGVIVGSAVIERCEELDSGVRIVGGAKRAEANSLSTIHNSPSTLFKWHLAHVERIKTHRKPTKHPQPVWFRPF